MALRDGELRPTLSVSVPSEQRDAFYAALADLKRHDERIFASASTLIVEAVLAAAERLRKQERGQRTRAATVGSSRASEDARTARGRVSA